MAQFTFRCLDSMADVDADGWRHIYGDATEGFDYFRACERAPAPSFSYCAIAVFEGDRLVAGAPVFRTTFDPAVFLEGAARAAVRLASRAIPAIAHVPAVGVGSPHSQESTIAFAPELTLEERKESLAALARGIDHLARTTGARVTLLKDIGQDEADWGHEVLTAAGYARATALPVAVVPVPETEEAYFSSLSGNMRSNLRRRLKRARNVEVEILQSCEGLSDRLFALRSGTLARASHDFAQFAETAPGFYAAVLDGAHGHAHLLTYRLDGELIGFSMVLTGPQRMVQNYNGMRYPEGPDHGLFYIDWMTQMRLCMELGMREIQCGVTTYLIKARLGSIFNRRYLYVRHRYAAINAIIAPLVTGLDLEESDAGLAELGERAPFA